jgi:hypothetical protein
MDANKKHYDFDLIHGFGKDRKHDIETIVLSDIMHTIHEYGLPDLVAGCWSCKNESGVNAQSAVLRKVGKEIKDPTKEAVFYFMTKIALISLTVCREAVTLKNGNTRKISQERECEFENVFVPFQSLIFPPPHLSPRLPFTEIHS